MFAINSLSGHLLVMTYFFCIVEKRSLMNIIRTRQKNWIGHILRGNSLQREIMEGRRIGKGRRRQKLVDWMMEDG